MIGFLDLPPELRSIIYQLLDPVEQGQRITFELNPLDSNVVISNRARCIQEVLPHEKRHSAHNCRVDTSSTTLHHFDFTDLMSLARTHKILYEEASSRIYPNFGLTLSLHGPPRDMRLVHDLARYALLDRYLERQRPTTLEMFDSLAINDGFAPISFRAANTIVDVVGARMPNMSDFYYHIRPSTAASPAQHLCMLRESFKTVRPFARFGNGVFLTFQADVPPDLDQRASEHSEFKRLASDFTIKVGIKLTLKIAGRQNRDEIRLLLCEQVLIATLPLRSISHTDVQWDGISPYIKAIEDMEEDLMAAEKSDRDLVRLRDFFANP